MPISYRRFRQKLADEARISLAQAQVLICDLMHWTLTDWVLNQDDVVHSNLVQIAQSYALRMAKGEPLSRILGSKDFFGRPFNNRNCLDPRPETELLVEEALTEIMKKAKQRYAIVDLGTGSGVIPITLVLELAERNLLRQCSLDIVGVDCCEKALITARDNELQLIKKEQTAYSFKPIQWISSSWFTNVPKECKFDLVLANPPYIAEDWLKTVDPEMYKPLDFDPQKALYAGKEGMDAYCSILQQLPPHRAEQGTLIFEIGFDQADAVSTLLMDSNYHSIKVKKDYAGLDRIVMASWSS